jgi:glycosyltransferase involved in cell wall biosynthesis
MSIFQAFHSKDMYAVIKERDNVLERLHRANRGVTVCIPCYNQQEELRGALDSVYAQTIAPVEILIIDDGSDAPIQLVDERAHVRLIRVTNRGLPSARNVGLMNTQTLGFLPLDADDRIAPEFIEQTLPLLETADVVLTGLQEHGTRNGRYNPGFDVPFDAVTPEMMKQMNRFYYCSLFRTELLRSVGGYNGRMIHGYEDWDLWQDLMNRGAKFACINEPLFLYTTKADGMLADTEANWRQWCLEEMERHHG